MLASLNNEEPGCIYSTDKPHEKGDNPLKTYEVSPLHALCMSSSSRKKSCAAPSETQDVGIHTAETAKIKNKYNK